MSLLDCMKSEAFTINVLSDPEFDPATGLPATQTVTPTAATGSIQPVTGEELLRVPEGDRKRKRLDIYTEDLVNFADKIIINAITYEVDFIETWNDDDLCVGNFYKVRVIQKDV